MSSLLDSVFPLADTSDWPPGLPQHLSAQQIGMYQRCPEQYRRRYLLGVKERPSAAVVWGRADHAAHELNFTQKIESHEDLPVGDVEDAFVDAFDRAVDEYGDEVEWDEKPAEVKDAGVRLVAVYHTVVSPRVQPTTVEREFSLAVPGVPVPLVGRVDLETAESAIERKTSRAMTREPKPEWRVQGLLYQAEHRRRIDWHVATKTRKPAVYTPEDTPGLTLPVHDRMVDAAQVLVRNTARSIMAHYSMFGPSEPWPGALTHPWACGYCGFRPFCSWWGN